MSPKTPHIMPAGKMYKKRYKRKAYKKKRAGAPKRGHRVNRPGRGGGLANRKLQPYIETKHVTLASDGVNLNQSPEQTGPTVFKPANCSIIVPEPWSVGLQQGVTANDFIGNSVFDRFLSLKCSLDFSSVDTGDATSFVSDLRYIQGWCTMTQANHNFSVSDLENVDYMSTVGQQLIASNLGTTFLSYGKSWKSIKVISSGRVKPANRNRNLQPLTVYANPAPAPTAVPTFSSESIPPNWNKEFKWTIKRKTFLHQNKTTTQHVRNRSWIPFVAFYCPTMSNISSEQTPILNSISKLYFSDS